MHPEHGAAEACGRTRRTAARSPTRAHAGSSDDAGNPASNAPACRRSSLQRGSSACSPIGADRHWPEHQAPDTTTRRHAPTGG
ncbi:hypothetical protein P0F65_04825 [Sphingomonas sp. I4]